MPARDRDYADEAARRRILDEWRAEHGNVCPGYPWCDVPNLSHRAARLSVDHVKPRSKGGTLADGWRVMCITANARRNAGRPAPHHATAPPSRRW